MKTKRIILNTWSGAFFNPGGGEVQLIETEHALGNLNYELHKFNMWAPQKDADYFLQFSVGLGTHYPLFEYKKLGIKTAISTILWTHPPVGSYEHEYIRRMLDASDLVFTNSNMESSRLSKAFNIENRKFFKTRNAIAKDYFSLNTGADFRSTYKIDGPFVLCVANIDRRKNTLAALNACKKLGMKLVLIGAIRDTEYFEEVLQSHPSGYLNIGPIYSSEMLKSAYQQAELFFLPSFCETPSLAAMEALSQGCKVVITSEGSTREYFEDNAVYVDPNNHDSIVQGLEVGLKGKAISEEVIKKFKEEYTWTNTAQDIHRAFQSLQR